MSHLYFVLTKRCNQVCNSCPRRLEERIKDESRDLVFQRLVETIDTYHVDHVTLSGGEPSLFAGFPYIVSYLVKRKIEVLIQSNSLNFSDRSFVDHCFGSLNEQEKKKITVMTAIHSSDAEIHDWVTKVPGSQNMALTGINYLCEHHIPVIIKCILGKHNYQMLPDFYNWLQEHVHGEFNLCISGMDYIGIDEAVLSDYAVNYKEVKDCIEKLMETAIINKVEDKLRIIELPLCMVDETYHSFFYINKSRGMLYQDASMNRPTDRIHDFAPDKSACMQCSLQQKCPGIWDSHYSMFGEETIHAM